MDEAERAAALVTIRRAVERGWVAREQVREAAILQEQLRAAGRPTHLLTVLVQRRMVEPDRVPTLRAWYQEALAEQEGPATAAAAAARAPEPVDERPLEVPPHLLAVSGELLSRPPEEDPEAVKAVVQASGGFPAVPPARDPRAPDAPRDPRAPDAPRDPRASVRAGAPPSAAREADGEPVDDRTFVSLALKAGYPTRDELRALGAAQQDERRRGASPSLLELARARGVLDARRARRFERWAAQVRARAQEPLTEDEDAPEAAPGAPGPGDAGPTASRGAAPPAPAGPAPPRPVPVQLLTPRVLASSAADFQLVGGRCARCGGDVAALEVLEGRARPAGDGVEHVTCPPPAAPAGAARADGRGAAGPGGAATAGAEAGRKKGRVRKVAGALGRSAVAAVRVVTRAPADPAALATTGRQSVALVGLGVLAGVCALGAVAVGLSVARARLAPGPGDPAPGAEPDPAAGAADVEAAWVAAVSGGPSHEAPARLRAFAAAFPGHARASDAATLAHLLEGVAAAPPAPGALAAQALAEAERAAGQDPGAASAWLALTAKLDPSDRTVAARRRALADAARRARARAREEALARARAGELEPALARLLVEARRWGGADDAADWVDVLRDVLAAAPATGRPAPGDEPSPDRPPDLGLPPVAPDPPPAPGPIGPAAGDPGAARPGPGAGGPALPAGPGTATPSTPGGAGPTAGAGPAALLREAIERLARDDRDGLARVVDRLEADAPATPEAAAARGFLRHLDGDHAGAVAQLTAAGDVDATWVPWVLVRSAFFAGRMDEARAAAAALAEPGERAAWTLLVDGPFRARAPNAWAACEARSPEGRYRVVTDLGVDVAALEAALARAAPADRPKLVERARKRHEALAELGDLMDKAAKAYANLFKAEPRERLVPTVFVLSDEAAFHAFSAALGSGSTESTLGYYMPGRRVLVFYERGGGRHLSRATLDVLLHETFHQWIRLHVADPPTWFDEGLAEYFAYSEVTSGGLRIGLVPTHHPSRLDNIREALTGVLAPPLPLPTLLRVDHPTFMQGQQAAVNYAHSWSFAHFLMADPGGQKLLRDYFHALRAGRGREGAYADVFARLDPAGLERAWRQHVGRIK